MTGPEHRVSEPRYEARDVDVRWLGIGALIAGAGLAAALLLTWGVLRLGEPVPGADLPRLPEAPMVPRPRLQVAPEAELHAFLAQKHHRLSSYGWVDRERGVAHVPIEVAMQHVAKEGLPSWVSTATDDAGTTAHRARQRALGSGEGP